VHRAVVGTITEHQSSAAEKSNMHGTYIRDGFPFARAKLSITAVHLDRCGTSLATARDHRYPFEPPESWSMGHRDAMTTTLGK